MVHGISPSMPQPPGSPPPNNPQLNQWSQAVQDFIDHYSGIQNMSMFIAAQRLLEAYKNGEKPFKSPQDVLKDLQTNVFNNPPLDVYANSMLGEPKTVQDFLKIFGITPPPHITPIDQLFLKYMKAHYSGLPGGNNLDLWRDLHGELMELGSQGKMADFQKWINRELNSDAFKSAPAEAQNFFRHFL